MQHLFRTFTKRFFIISNIIVAALYLLACCTAFLNPDTYWFISILGVTFAAWLVMNVGFVVFWLLFRSKWALLSFVVLIISWPQLNAFFAFHPFTKFSHAKKANTIRVMQWNVARWDEMNKYWAPGKISKRKKMFEYIANNEVDILCVEEFFESNNTKEFAKNIPYITDSLHFPYHYFAMDHRRWDSLYETGVVIFSKYPIVDTFRKRYGGPDSLKNNESFIWTDIDVNGKRIRVFATHMQSMLFGGKEYRQIKQLRQSTDSAVVKTRGIIKKFRRAYALRMHQVDVIKPVLDNSPYPEIMCGDFNEVPNSYIYFQMKGNRQDAFSKKGFGISRTLSFISPTLRIDYILPNKQFKVLQYKSDKVALSDHYPVITDLQLPE
jgi:endonuclease/exonuclease/phosphatase family metal-dependent hydrolase